MQSNFLVALICLTGFVAAARFQRQITTTVAASGGINLTSEAVSTDSSPTTVSDQASAQSTYVFGGTTYTITEDVSTEASYPYTYTLGGTAYVVSEEPTQTTDVPAGTATDFPATDYDYTVDASTSDPSGTTTCITFGFDSSTGAPVSVTSSSSVQPAFTTA